MNTGPQTIQSHKKPYTPPNLINYGQVRSLTNASTSGSTEGSQGSGVMKPGSDRRIKEDIIHIGAHPLGIGLYLFDYKPEYRETWGHGRQFGVMADEVERVMPEAVSVHPDGYKMVNYRMLGISRNLH
jgi:hypothetical protein